LKKVVLSGNRLVLPLSNFRPNLIVKIGQRCVTKAWISVMKRILVVDDELHIGELYKSELEDEGYSVTIATSGQEALAAVETSPPDLIVLDIQMPGMDGIETLEKLVGSDKGIPIILNTAYSHYKEDFTTWGADAYVIKSSDTSKLKAEIKRLLGQ
jgi:CheY-like chemotaxis protein